MNAMNRSWIRVRWAAFLGCLGLAMLGLMGCSGGGTNASGPTQYYGNYHPLGWLDGTHGQKAHGSQAVADLTSCTRCHEISILKVGSGVPTCMTTGCHHQATPGFRTSEVHGLRAKLAKTDAAGGSLFACQICHARDFSGGGSTNACSSCHGVSAPHPVKPWRALNGSTQTHATTDPSNAVVCAQCHRAGSSLNPPGHPASPAPAATQPDCFNATLCHAEAVPHPIPFLKGNVDSSGNGHLTATAGTFASDCSACHAHSGSSPIATAPLCNACHKLADPVAAGTQAGTCLSCHVGTPGLPQGPGGTAFPSVAGAHGKHLALATRLSCDTCHAGSGTGTTTHYVNAKTMTSGPAPVAMDPTFNAKSGNSAFTPASQTCSNVSCHGGKVTPAWQGGVLQSATQCTACHAVATTAGTATQFNDAFGRHSLGTHNVANGTACTTCHNMANGSPGALAHFKYLNTPAVDGVATGTPADQLSSGTIAFDPAVVSGNRTYTVTATTQGNGGCALTCHTHIHTAAVHDWSATGVPHPVPFLAGQSDTQGYGHLNATATIFAADCANCHAHSGASPVATAPLCNVCHTLANPTTPGTQTGTCLSCHQGTAGLPAGPGGTGFPSIAGAHAKHMALPTALTCDSCHTGSGSGTATHYANANARTVSPTAPASVAMDPAFKAKSGNPSFSPASLTCSNVSCHGGQTTPDWQAGTLNASTQCTACHGVSASAGAVTQFNDAFGRHSQGSHDATKPANSIACTTCHNMDNGTQGALAHFKYLNTSAVDGVATGTPADQTPSDTIVFDPLIVSAPGTYTVTSATEGNGSCALTCHTHIHTPAIDTWTASGASHPIPFYAGQTDSQGNAHLTTTAATFAANCATCHAHSGTSPLNGAPVCATCHSLANPTLAATGAGTCLSCHVGSPGLPQGPTGASYPSIQGAHLKHMGLPTTLSCDSCHANVGAGTNTHYDNANARVATPTGPGAVSIDATFHAQTGPAAAFNPTALTCSSVSCHGGLVAPNWQTGAITSTSQCTLCHAINGGASTSQYNDAVGRHAWGTHNTAGALDCTICHDMTQATPGVQRHFAELDTTPVSSTSKRPSTTIKFKLNHATYPITGAGTYTINASYPEGDGGCALTCHSVVHTNANNHWNMPQGSGMSHPKPYLSTDVSTAGNRHQTLTLVQFNSECITCHDLAGAQTKSGPSCSVCHTLGDPTATATGAGTCLSCHVGANFRTLGPQGPSNQAWPNQPGSHAKHVGLLTFTRGSAVALTSPGAAASPYPVCEACHVGSTPGDAANTHYSNANKRVAGPTAGPASVLVDATFNSRASTAAYPSTTPATAFTCSSVSCHGGQVTPGWQTGTITKNATTYCIACHKVTSTASSTQYNDATGRHNESRHKYTCDYCHDMNQARPGAQNHFKYLDTQAVRVTPDQLSSETILFGSSVTGARTYTTTGTIGRGGCALSCHGDTHTTSGNVWN